MRIGTFYPGLLLFIIALLPASPSSAKNPLDEAKAFDVLVSRIQKDRLYDRWTSLACLSFVKEGEGKNYYDIAIHEKHGGGCPGDPNTAPVVDRFRVNKLTGRIQWYDPAEGRFLPYKDVLRGRSGH